MRSRSRGGAIAHTYVRNRIHISFSTKGRRKQIPPEVQPGLWNFMGKVAAERSIEVLAVGGIEHPAERKRGHPWPRFPFVNEIWSEVPCPAPLFL